jgi:GNAT superfamily N-acetyltransferase
VGTPVFRPASLDDAELAADLMTAAYPPEPQDPLVTRFRWAHPRHRWTQSRFIAELDRHPIACVALAHGPWEQVPEGHCELDVSLDRARQSNELTTVVWDWIAEEAAADGARILHAFAAEDEPNVLDTLHRLGYEPGRRDKVWELDLRAHGDRLVAEAESARTRMKKEHIELLTLARWSGPDTFRQLHSLNELAVQDIPHTIPILAQTFENFMDRLGAPDLPHDRFWIAREGDRAVAVSYLRFPPVRGNVWTGFTCSHPEYRGKGIARAVKLQSLAQAIELGIPFVRTANDSVNAPMLHINETLGYGPRPGFVSLMKRVSSP